MSKSLEKTKINLLIDGDVVLYKAGFGSQSKENPDPPLSHALANTKRVIENLINKIESYNFKILDVTIILSADNKSNFRYEVAKTQPYKGNRAESVKPIHYDAIKEYILKNYKSILVEGQEADDEMGILATLDPAHSMIVSSDKDMRMIPCWHYEMSDREPFYVEDNLGYLELIREDGKAPKLFGIGMIWFYSQILTGDRADHIPGIPGCGIVKAYALLKDCKSVEEGLKIVKRAYRDANLSEDRLKEVSELLWIRRVRPTNEDESKSKENAKNAAQEKEDDPSGSADLSRC